MKSPRRMTLTLLVSVSAAMSSLTFGCAGVKTQTAGAGGNGGTVTPPPIAGLVSIEVMPGSFPVALTASGATLSGTGTFTATGHFQDGHTEDVTSRVGWPSQFRSLHVQGGVASVSAPGTYTITAASGSVMGMATLIASFSGNRYADGFDPSGAAVLDGAASPGATIVYPLDKSIFPPNLNPVTVHVSRSNANQSAARINFSSENVVNVNYYAPCVPGAGNGCYVDLPLEITQLFIAVSESHDVQLTARVGGVGATLVESAPINVAWANVPLSGGLYYWTTMADGVVTGYHPPRNADGSPGLIGTGIQRYDFGKDGAAAPQLIYTDQGHAPTFYGSPAATTDRAQCVGCHAISNDGKTMALTIGGSANSDFALLDLTTLTMTVLDAAASAGITSVMDINYYSQFRKSMVASETSFGPNGDLMVNMYKSQLYLTGVNASLLRQGPILTSWAEYKSDPFWSQTGKFLVFTSFDTPDVYMFNPTGLNGDMKRRGQIVIASATSSGINNDAHVLAAREANVTKYYPAVSNDDKLVVYNQSNCGIDPDAFGSGYGSQTCDGYDDSSATLWLTSPDGARPVRLDGANGQFPYDNSWPRWSPDNGTFRGQQLYWLAFSSRRPYGLQANLGALATTKPQLWFSAILVGGEGFTDPSRPPVWLPNQNPTVQGGVINQVPTGNHVPQWVKVAVVIPG
jgi:hypothetical protein